MRKALSILCLISLASMPVSAQIKVSGIPVDLSQATFIPYPIDSAFSISVPDYLVPVDYLSMDARLQFSNDLMNAHMIVATETKSKQEENDLASLVHRFEQKVKAKGGKIHQRDDRLIAGCRSQTLKVTWTVDGESFMYVASFIDTPKMIYKVYSWTSTSQKELEPEFRRIAMSFAAITVEDSFLN